MCPGVRGLGRSVGGAVLRYPRSSPRRYDAVANGIELCIIRPLPFMKSTFIRVD